MSNRYFSVSDFAESFGLSPTLISPRITKYIEGRDPISIEIIEGMERDDVIRMVLEKIQTDQQKIGIKERTQVWEDGWAESLNDFLKAETFDEAKKSLTPKFVRPGLPFRWNGNYVRSSDLLFEKTYIELLRIAVFDQFFQSFDGVVEFGAGTGHNLVHFSDLAPEKNFIGTDFVQPAVDLINSAGQRFERNISGVLCDMLNPNIEFEIPENHAVFTFGSLEQLASRIDNIFDYFVSSSAGRFVHIEPCIDLYNPSSLFDYLAYTFQSNRGYTDNLLSKLKSMEANQQISVIEARRLGFGSLMMEGYNLFVWEKA